MGIKKNFAYFLFLFVISIFFCCSIVLAYDWSEVVKKVKPATATIHLEWPGEEKQIDLNAPIIDSKGLILTCFHVLESMVGSVSEGTEVKIIVQEKEYEWNLIGADPLNDLALIKLKTDKQDFPFLEINQQIPLEGQEIMCLGAPIGQAFTLTTGNIGREYVDEPNWPRIFIQHSAEIFYGSSGSAIIDTQGKIAGVNFAAIFLEKGNPAPGQYFAIPSSVIFPRIDRMKQGWWANAEIGVSSKEKELLETGEFGLLIYKIFENSIFKNILKENDIITRIQGTKVSEEKFLEDVITFSLLPFETINLAIIRKIDGDYKAIEVNIPIPYSNFKKFN